MAISTSLDITEATGMAVVQAFVFVTVGILSIRNEKTNPMEPTNVTCVVRMLDVEKDMSEIFLTTGSNRVGS